MVEWRPVFGYEGLYEVSSLGSVRSMRKHLVMSPGRTRDGYPQINLYKDGTRKTFRVHTLVLCAFKGPRPSEKSVARHLDGNPENLAIDNLEWGTQSENVKDSIRHGTQKESRKTHCPYGHSYIEENTYRNGSGHRSCRSCMYARSMIADPGKDHRELADKTYEVLSQRALKQAEKEAENER